MLSNILHTYGNTQRAIVIFVWKQFFLKIVKEVNCTEGLSLSFSSYVFNGKNISGTFEGFRILSDPGVHMVSPVCLYIQTGEKLKEKTTVS